MNCLHHKDTKGTKKSEKQGKRKKLFTRLIACLFLCVLCAFVVPKKAYSMTDLLPPSATPQERALAAVSQRLENLPVPYRDLWNPQRCPLELLTYLAYTFSVDQWDELWPEHIKRQTVTNALHQHRIKGTRAAVENAISSFGTLAKVTEWWEQSPKGTPHTFTVDISAQDNEQQQPVWQMQGQAMVYCAKAIPVDTGRVYRLRFKVRQFADATIGGQLVYAGIAMLDQQYNCLHAPGPWLVYDLQMAAGWLTFQGEVTGSGAGEHQFLPGTAFIRPMFCVNYDTGNGTAQVAELSCVDLFENRQLIPNPFFKEGKQGWSQQHDGATVPDNAPGQLTTAPFRPDGDLQTDIINAITRAKPLRSDFELKVGTVHPGNFYWTAAVYPVVMIRETFGP